MKLIDLTGQTFGRLTVLSRQPSDSRGSTCWLCKCKCGNTIITKTGHLRPRHTQSCGCLREDQAKKSFTTHGMGKTKIYSIWGGMIARCQNKKEKSYKNYGGRGITVCERWFKFENFYADMGDPLKGLSIERIDNNKGYFPDNCKWATRKEQQNNSRANILIEYQGQCLTLSQWADKIGIKYPALWDRIRKANWSLKKALTQGRRKKCAMQL